MNVFHSCYAQVLRALLDLRKDQDFGSLVPVLLLRKLYVPAWLTWLHLRLALRQLHVMISCMSYFHSRLGSWALYVDPLWLTAVAMARRVPNAANRVGLTRLQVVLMLAIGLPPIVLLGLIIMRSSSPC